MRLSHFLLFLCLQLFASAQTGKKIHLKNTIKKYYSETQKDTISEFFMTEEFDEEGKLSMKVEFINGNFGDITTYHYRDTFLFKKIITHNLYSEYDTVTYEDSIIREERFDLNPFFKDSVGIDKNGRVKTASKPLGHGNKLIITTFYETRNDSRLVHDYTTKKDEIKRSFYQLVHDYYTEYDSSGRKIAYFKSIDEWETDWEHFYKYNYDENGFLSEIRKLENLDVDGNIEDTGSLRKKILSINSGSNNFTCKTENLSFPGYTEVNFYNDERLMQSLSLSWGDPQQLHYNRCYSYDKKGNILEEAAIIGDLNTLKTYTYLNGRSSLISEIETIQKGKNDSKKRTQEKFIYDESDNLLTESYKKESGVKSDWFVYEYTFH
jgi:hypothetical protein